MNAIVTALEHRMRRHDRAKFIGRFPERIERGIVEHAALAFRLGADHDALEAGGMGFAQHLGGKLAILGRHGGERDEARLGLGGLRQMRVDEARPGGTFRGGQVVAVHVEPAGDDLAIDLLLVHPLQAAGQIAQRLRHRARRLTAGKGKAEARAVLDQADRRKLRSLRLDILDQARRNEMGVTIDDHVACSCGLPCWASAMASPIAEIRMGSLLKEMPSGETASLMALEIAAGDPR